MTGYTGTSKDVTVPATLGGAPVVSVRLTNLGLTSLDVTACTGLIYLSCSSNQLTSLNVSSNTELMKLYCKNNQLGSLDVSKNLKLTELVCSGCGLTTLDVTHNTSLEYLDASNNLFTELDLSDNPSLGYLDCYDCRLTSIDLNSNPKLLFCSIEENYIYDMSDLPEWIRQTDPPQHTPDISLATVSAIPDQTCTGTAITPPVTVTYGRTVLTAGTDYDVVYDKNVEVGTATVTITGKGDFTGTFTAYFRIVPAPSAAPAAAKASTVLPKTGDTTGAAALGLIAMAVSGCALVARAARRRRTF